MSEEGSKSPWGMILAQYEKFVLLIFLPDFPKVTAPFHQGNGIL